MHDLKILIQTIFIKIFAFQNQMTLMLQLSMLLLAMLALMLPEVFSG